MAVTGSETKKDAGISDADWVNFLRRKAMLPAVLSLTKVLIKKFKSTAESVLEWVSPYLEADRKTMALVSRAFGRLRSNPILMQLRLQQLNKQLDRTLKRKDYARLLWLTSRFEALEKAIPMQLGRMIAGQMVSEKGRLRINQAAAKALENAPYSPFLTYIYAVTLAKAGNYQDASLVVQERIEKLARRKFRSTTDVKAARKQFDVLRDTWRVVDQIAREDTGWLDTEGGGTYAGLVVKSASARARDNIEGWSVNFKEPLLQARDERAYLDTCRTEFEESRSLLPRLRIINEMLRQGVRRQFTFHRAYMLANESFDLLRPQLADLVGNRDVSKMTEKAAVKVVQIITTALSICRTLSRKDDIDTLKNELLDLSQKGLHPAGMWLILPALVAEDEDVWGPRSESVLTKLPSKPEKEGQLKAYLHWALRVRRFKEAEHLFSALPSALQSSSAALYLVNILQRQSRFTEALRLIKRVHTTMLTKPARLNPFQHWNLVRRHGELSFLHHTASAFHKVPQPKRPKGVIIIAPRNIDQLRKYPLVVLMELKRQGWAIVPLVEGLLPREMTGDPKLDLLNGCITVELGLREDAKYAFKPLINFKAEPSKGELHWMDLNFRHSMWEDARINRRTYDVDFSCPALVHSLQRLCDWTERVAQATEYAHQLLPAINMRCGLMSLFNSRLPDSLFRLFCDRYGDPDGFFCLQAANGYENYFKRFGTNLSTRCVIRNVTRDKLVRSASMPNPILFDRYFSSNRHMADGVMARVETVTQMRRPTGNAPDPLALECENRIMEWRAKGGHVACLFGRVVCDSAVPFDGGPVHEDLRDWLRHSIEAVRDSNTMLLIKPHPHELNEQIATYLNQYFTDLIDVDFSGNVVVLGHSWFDVASLKRFVDLGLIYNGTTAIEMALLEIPCILAGHFAPIDYSVGHIVPESRQQYEAMLRFEVQPKSPPDARARAAMWLEYMSNGGFAVEYRYHARPITNKVVYPPYWIKEDINTYLAKGDPNVSTLAGRVTGAIVEPSK